VIVVIIDTCLQTHCVRWVRVMWSVVAVNNVCVLTGGCPLFMNVLRRQQPQCEHTTYTQSRDAPAD
jgi:hypothetical protein